MDSINAIDLLKEEMESDEIHLKVNAIHKLKTVALAISRDDYRNQLVPYLEKIIQAECDEVLFSIAAELGNKEIVDAGGLDVVFPLLERLAKSDETVVREEASKSMNLLTDLMSDADIQGICIPVILKLAQSEWFPGRVSACSMFHTAYPKAGSYKESLRKRFLELCNEDTPIVRRSGSKELGIFACTIEKEFVINEILPIFRRLAQDEQDAIRIICIESLIPLANYLTKEENQVNTLGAILAAGEDKNWKVRLTFAKNFAELSEALGKHITDCNLIQTFSNFLSD
jgi:serine/threonine-protein phosphatase 2A regulatory subunit A